MTDFLLRDWKPTVSPAGPASKAWIRDDSWILVYEQVAGSVFLTALSPDAIEAGRALVAVRDRDGALILTPVSHAPDVVADAVAFWTHRPTIHIAALGLAEDMTQRAIINPVGTADGHQEEGTK